MRKLTTNERGAALLETAITVPIILLICVGIFEFGVVFQTWQVITNAAREGSRAAVIFGTTQEDIQNIVMNYADGGGLKACGAPGAGHICMQPSYITIDRNVKVGERTASKVQIDLPYSFMVLDGIFKLVNKNYKPGGALTMHAVSTMRNESS